MTGYQLQAQTSAALLAALPGWRDLQAARPDLDQETVEAILGEAAKFAEGRLALVNSPGDAEGCRLDGGRVRTPSGYAQAYQALAGDGWIGMDLDDAHGGQGLPVVLHTAAQMLFDRGCTALMMLAGSSRAAAHLLAAHADASVREDWVPALCSGHSAATICISEPDAGSDVGRIRTRGEQRDGVWHITGQKIWISFGDHDMAPRIGHCLLARTSDAPGTRGLSLFLVPDVLEDGRRNAIVIERIEEKMGLHGSPTCSMQFEGAEGILIGEEGRGLSQLFTMMEFMRLQTGAQGLGLALGAAGIAAGYIHERHQGGDPKRAAVPISAHGDVRRQVLDLSAKAATLHMAVLDLALLLDRIELTADPDTRAALEAQAAFTLPIIKTFGAETAFETASAAMQVLGGAGYTREWPVEQILRDCRVLAIYEGTTGMQAQDFLMRRLWRENGAGLKSFLGAAHSEIDKSSSSDSYKISLKKILEQFETLSTGMDALKTGNPRAGEFAAEPYLRAGWAAVSALNAWRLSQLADQPRLAALGTYRLDQLEGEFAFHAGKCHAASNSYDVLFETAFPEA
ncbi:acyl-CoA dehydrogenase family protein [Roseibium litorale]|uniref:Acyl-CoA dehydrogenase family protein n=1 Tax=Roseibium litorale TaxID=2803841 RepID=A0ABR9CIZ2_9HYPH|nr:acyl-CoA dehydrogenase family protein [Roseibium litorale]MBD8890790.1 acyl-CoA dehydrogenase family protein [Roseibium litorale]